MFARIGGQVLVGAAIGAGLAAAYGVLVAVVHLAVHSRLDRAHVLVLAFVVVGTIAGLLTAWAYSGHRRRARPTIRLSRHNLGTLCRQ
jgi:hypothetical protein